MIHGGLRAHGGRLNAARREFPGAAEPFIDLSTGINPFPYRVGRLARSCWSRLPEQDDLDDLLAAACEAYGAASPELVCAAPGTQILIGLLPYLFPGRRVAILGPTYNEHAACWRKTSRDCDEVVSLEQAADAEIVILCNPNNPDGRIIAAGRLRALADRLAARDGLLVVDEAFADFAPDGFSLVPHMPHPAVIVLRSFGKAYGLGGLRLGFAVADGDRAATIREALGPWAVAGPAIAIGRRALRDKAWKEDMRRTSIDVARRLDGLLARAGFEIVGGTALFRLARHPGAEIVRRRLGQAGILVRSFEDRPEWLRFGLPAREVEWRRLDKALARMRRR